MTKKISLCEKYPNAELTLLVHDEASTPRPAVIVCPGGAYFSIADREGEPIARFFYNAGLNAYILRYSISPAPMRYNPLIELSLAIKYVRENAAEHNTAPNKILTCGFSAGGHLAASAGILWNIPEVRDALGITDGTAPEGINRPDGMILSYPVITAGKYYPNNFSIQNLSESKCYSEEDAERFSLERHVDSTTPPMFIWHTASDEGVPVKNAMLLVDAYIENSLSFEAHIYPFGPHGLSLATEETEAGKPDWVNPHAATWTGLAHEWIKDTFK